MRFLTFLILFVFLMACSNDPASTTDDFDAPTLSKLEGTGEAGAEASVAVTDMENDMQTLEDMDVVQLDDASGFSINEFSTNFQSTVEKLHALELSINKSDSILYADTTNVPGGGVRTTLIYYDTETQKGHIIEVADFTGSDHRAMDKDSTHIILDMGATPWDFSDDVFESAYEYRHYREEFHLEYSEASFILNEVTRRGRPVDFTMSMDQHFRDFARLSLIQVRLVRHSNRTGSISQKVIDQEGNTYEYERIFNGDGTGSYTRNLPNGVSITGTFNILRDDNNGGFTRVITFPSGFELSQISVSAAFVFDPANFLLSGDIIKVYTLADGGSDTVFVSLSREFDSMNDHMPIFSTMSMTSTYGMSSYLEITHAEENAQLSGWWITADGHYALLTGTRYFGDMSTLNVALYESKDAYEANEAPLATAVFETLPDGSGEATITVGDETYTFTYDASGKGTLKKLNGAVTAVEVRI